MGFVVYDVVHPNWLHFDGNAAFAFDVHLVQQLRFHVARLHRMCHLQKPVSQSRLSVINMRYHNEISDMVRVMHKV